MIKESGGMVFIPHIYQYESNWKKILDYLLENCNIDRIECYYSTFSDDQTDFLLNLCNNKGMFISGGSDYHGLNRREIEIGIGKGNLRVADEIIRNWIDKVIQNA
jgi:predicted metal-dependent phosphoesterase TrpH